MQPIITTSYTADARRERLRLLAFAALVVLASPFIAGVVALMQQAANNSKEQFANSPDLKSQLLNAIMVALRKRYRCTTMSDHDPAGGSQHPRPALRSGAAQPALGG